MSTSSLLLEVAHCSLRFGGIAALTNVSLTIQKGQLVGLIGPNGAGKTSLFNILTGVYKPTEGEIFFQEHPIVGLPPHKISMFGIARTFQNIRLFGSLNVELNVRISFVARLRSGLMHTILRGSTFRMEEEEIRHKCHSLLAYFGLESIALHPSRSLSYGDQRRLEIVRALATKPSLLLLDEPAAGMNPTEKKELKNLIYRIRDEFGTAVLLVEHDMNVVMGICEQIYVMEQGKVLAVGTPEEIRSDPNVIASYLGKPHEEKII